MDKLNLNFIKDVQQGQAMIYNSYFKSEDALIERISELTDEENYDLADDYAGVELNYTTPLIIQESDVIDMMNVMEITESTTNEQIVEFCAYGDKKKYPNTRFTEINNHEQVKNLDGLSEMIYANENDIIFVEKIDDALWLQELANAYQYLEDNDVKIDYNLINVTDDFISYAKNHAGNNK